MFVDFKTVSRSSLLPRIDVEEVTGQCYQDAVEKISSDTVETAQDFENMQRVNFHLKIWKWQRLLSQGIPKIRELEIHDVGQARICSFFLNDL